jgi:hypothetical protein
MGGLEVFCNYFLLLLLLLVGGVCCYKASEVQVISTLCVLFHRCVSGHAFFYAGERCQAMHVHGSLLGLLIGCIAGLIFLTFVTFSTTNGKLRQ